MYFKGRCILLLINNCVFLGTVAPVCVLHGWFSLGGHLDSQAGNSSVAAGLPRYFSLMECEASQWPGL